VVAVVAVVPQLTLQGTARAVLVGLLQYQTTIYRLAATVLLWAAAGQVPPRQGMPMETMAGSLLSANWLLSAVALVPTKTIW
jgi:hypothetical protein